MNMHPSPVKVTATGDGRFLMLHQCGHDDCRKNGQWTCALCDDGGPPAGAGLFDEMLRLRVCHSCGLPENARSSEPSN